MTVREAYDLAVSEFVRMGLDYTNARSDARILVDHFAKLPFAHLVKPEMELNEEDIEWNFGEIVQHVPIPYIVGQRGFFGLTFRCDNRALIPRPETELLVENAIATLKNRDRVLVADLGTGSGCIAVSIAHELPQSVVYATDLSRDALELAESNVRRHNVANRVEFVEGRANNWALPLVREGFAGMFDCVVTNPPYISKADIEELPLQIKEHEPLLALDGGNDGLDCYRDIAAQCGELLAPDGFLLAELGAGQFADVKQIFENENWQVAPPILDFSAHQRVLRATPKH